MYIKHHEELERFLKAEEELESTFSFPDKDIKTICIQKWNDEGDKKFFYLYDVFAQRFTRKIFKQDFEIIDDESAQSSAR